MAVTKDQAATYRQLTHKLRFIRAAGGPEVTSVRPRREKSGEYLDELPNTPAPLTFVTFEEGDRVDVDFLLRAGAITPHAGPPKRPAEGG